MIFSLRNKRCFLSIVLIALCSCQNMSPNKPSQTTAESDSRLSISDEPVSDMRAILEDAKQNASAARQSVTPPKNVMQSLLPPLIPSKKVALLESRFDINVKAVNAQSLFFGLVKDTPYNTMLTMMAY